MVRQLLVLSGLAAIGAVINHSAHYMTIAMFWWTDRYRAVTAPNYDAVNSVGFYLMALVVPIAVTAVPAFLFISGFFIAAVTGRGHGRVGWKPVLSRIRSLIWPYLFWSLVIICMAVVLDGKTYTPRTILWALFTGGATAAFYYIPLLIFLYLLSPLISPIAKNNPWLLLSLGALLLVGAIVSRYAYFFDWDVGHLEPLFKFFRNWQFSANFLWFALGMVTGFHLVPFKKRLATYRWGLLIALIVVYGFVLLEWGMLRRVTGQQWIAPASTAMNQLLMLLLLLSYLAFANLSFPFSAQLGVVGSMAYGIYLIHIPVLTFATKAVYHLVPGLLGYYFLLELLLVTAGVVLPMLMMQMVCRSPAARYYQYIFG